ncbi:unnamed protein product [Mycena citricolor]|uniref:Uncharacterized protein n=1 Tax=Mycena citricolor TaxID=2018698 RepID=A0AAD2K6X6_9AGAR|nr:unnamed protein product [Mycena citricolor]
MGSLLLSTPKITSRTNPIHPPVIQTMPSALPQPDWSLVLQGSSTDSWKSRHQLESELTELRAHLKRAQVQSQVQSQMLQEGQAQCLSSNEFFDQVRSIEMEKQEKNAEKLRKKALRDDKKAAKAALEEQWVKIKEDHTVKVAKWEKECAKMVGKGARKKDLLAKPKCTKKPRLQEDADDDDDKDDGCQDES